MFKKILAAVLCLALCAGCGGSIEPQSYNLEFSFGFENGEEAFLVDAAVNDVGDITFIVTNPESIRELTLTFSGDTVHTKFLGVTQDMSAKDVDFGVLSDIYTAFSGLHNTTAQRQGDEYVAVVETEGNKYVFTLTDLGIPLSITINGTKTEFSNIKAG